MAAAFPQSVAQDGFLARYADELEALARGLERLQTTLSEARSMTQEAPQGQQALDELTQRAQALAEIARRMPGLEAFSDRSIRLMIANVKLADVAARLAGEPPPAARAPSGEVELF